jgi:branched-chain amino acid transport system permease protein
MNAQELSAQQSGVVLLMTYVGGVGYFFGPIIGAVIVTLLQTMLSDVTDVWQLYFGLLFMAVVLFSPGGIAGWLMLHEEAARRGEAWRLTPSYLMVAPAIAAGLAGAILIIELASRLLPGASGEGAAARLFGFDPASSAPWVVAIALLGAGGGFGRLLWPKVEDAWSDVDMRLRRRAKA